MLDTATLGVVLESDIVLDRFIVPGRFIVAAQPAPPLSLQAAVQGDRVQLTWTAGGPAASVIRYVLDVGSAPGRRDIFSAFDLGLLTTLDASGVPAGRYYVRVRAANYMGLSAPSNEVVVHVP